MKLHDKPVRKAFWNVSSIYYEVRLGLVTGQPGRVHYLAKEGQCWINIQVRVIINYPLLTPWDSCIIVIKLI